MITTPRPAPLALVVCGALAAEVRRILAQRGWQADLYGVPATYHMRPPSIVAAVDEHLERIRDHYRKVIVVYGDCGTAGHLDRVLERHRAERLAGEHCYEVFCGPRFSALTKRRPTTYFLTDFLVRNWEEVVVREMGLGRAPSLKGKLFAGFTSVTFLRQDPDTDLMRKAEGIAAYLGLPLEVEDVGTSELESQLERLLSDVE
ncbi:MAG: DUF1638 domain-containing protein [Gemmatimonadota bacterium]|nr:MAG: DUF1638 domain-containing protein [Gemmatimonadota bacterium]